MMKNYKARQFANEKQFEESQTGTVIWRAHQGPMRVNKPGRGLSKAEKKLARKISRLDAITKAAMEGKTKLKRRYNAIVSNLLTRESGGYNA